MLKKMKNILLYATLLATVLFAGCENTNENPVQERGKGVGVIMSEPVPAFFTSDIENSFVAFDLSLPEGETVEKSEIEVVYADKKALLKSIDIPVANLKVTAVEMVEALGISPADIEVGNTFYLYVLTTKNGLTTRSKAALAINVTCEFEPALSTGAYNFESSDWGASGNVTLEADPADPFRIFITDYPEAEGLSNVTGNRIELIINPNTFNVSGPAVVLSDDLSEWGVPYTAYTYQPVSGTYNSCNGSYTVVFAITVSAGSYGNNRFTFTRAQ
jgi:hypothetical protein